MKRKSLDLCMIFFYVYVVSLNKGYYNIKIDNIIEI